MDSAVLSPWTNITYLWRSDDRVGRLGSGSGVRRWLREI